MPTRRRLLAVIASASLAGCGLGSIDESTIADTSTDDSTPTIGGGGLAVSTPAFPDGGSIPARYTVEGADVSPRIVVESVPADTETLAVVVDDPDAGEFVHWLLWNVPADVTAVPEGVPNSETVASLDGARQGTNGFGELGYRGPAPPEGDGPHTYRFTVSALDTTLSVSPGAGRETLRSALAPARLARDRFTGEFDR